MVFYFSGSGNSYYVANMLSVGLDTPLISMADALKKRDMNFDARADGTCGFVFPVHFWGVPYLVTEFINNMQLKTNDDTYVYVVFTCGGDTGNAPKEFEKLMKNIHVKLSAVFSIQQIDIFVPIFKIPDKDKRDKEVLKAKIETENILNHIKAQEKGDFNTNKNKFALLETKLLYPMYSYYRNTSKFRVSDMCTACKKCEKICPLGVIEIIDNKPVWKQKKCTLCFACLHICPAQAINYGKMLFIFDSKNKGRYRNPYAPKGY